ncbi:hypothetical protein VE01_09083 [Pseudogymnoascus verrucosus]|uniref:Uncharacterized protein n=1 Tax=Pseudogymnoascus verrucosus TaxID=342668 RepID=A0A1B8GAH2_9PEZI|nr:uncharacterized protein VE01_09083 [Pseudogymnoascus verrucosus]OBT92824.1 hypothetical protein VE01_09083 [Pseudogymnoascus verrucosus]
MTSPSKMVEVIDYFRFLPDGDSPLDDEVAKATATGVAQWEMDPVIGGGPFRPYMVPRGVPVSDGVLVMMRLFSLLPFQVYGASRSDLQKIHGFTKTGTMQRRDSGADGLAKLPQNNGSTVYDAGDYLITIDQTVMRGDKDEDATNPPGPINECTFIYQLGLKHQHWFNRLFNGADTASLEKGAAFAQDWLTKYSSNIMEYDRVLGINVRRQDNSKVAQYEHYIRDYYYSEIHTRSTEYPKPKLAPTIKLMLPLKAAQKPKRKPKPDMAGLAESDKKNNGEGSKREMALAGEPGNLLPRPEVPAVAKKPRIYSAEESNESENKESEVKAVSTPAKTVTELAAEKSPPTVEKSMLARPNNMAPTPAETATERITRLRREVEEKSKALEDLRRMEADAAEQAIAEAKAEVKKATMERAAVERAAAEKAVAQEAAAKLAKEKAKLNTGAADNSLKLTGETVKYAIGAYLAQRRSGTADKTLVGKLNDELAPYFHAALNVFANDPQKRKLTEEESDDERLAKIAKK